MTFLKRRHKRTPLCTKKRRRERLSRAQIRVPLPPHHFCELDGRARIASSKGERFEPRENAEHTRRLEETREVSRPKNHQSHPSSRHSKRRRRHHQCAIESTYNNRNRKRLLKNGVETNHERACGAWCCYYFRAGKTSFVFFLASESSRTGRVASRARGLGFRVVFDEFFSFRHFFLFSLERVVFFVVSFYASSRRARKLWRRRRRRRRRSKNGRTQQTMWKNDFDEMTFRFCCTRFRSP